MATSTNTSANVDNFFASSAARFDRWRELNAKAQTWAAGARGGNARGGRAAVEAALAQVRPLEDFFAYPGARLMKTLAERIAADDALGSARLVRRISGALLTDSYRYESGQWESSDDYNPAPGLDRIQAVTLVINAADDERNPPELGIIERELKRVKKGRYLLIPASDQTAGHGTTGQAKFYKKELEEVLKSTPRMGTPQAGR